MNPLLFIYGRGNLGRGSEVAAPTFIQMPVDDAGGAGSPPSVSPITLGVDAARRSQGGGAHGVHKFIDDLTDLSRFIFDSGSAVSFNFHLSFHEG